MGWPGTLEMPRGGAKLAAHCRLAAATTCRRPQPARSARRPPACTTPTSTLTYTWPQPFAAVSTQAESSRLGEITGTHFPEAIAAFGFISHSAQAANVFAKATAPSTTTNTIDCTVALGSLHAVLLEAPLLLPSPPLLSNLPAQHHPEARHPRSFNWPAGWEEW